MAKVRGATILGTLDSLRQTFGEDGARKFSSSGCSGPAALFTRAASVWNNYQSAGRYVFEGAAGNRAAIRIEDWDGADPVMCKRIEGWIERALEITLGTGARPTIREEAHLRSDPAVSARPFCRYVAEWS